MFLVAGVMVQSLYFKYRRFPKKGRFIPPKQVEKQEKLLKMLIKLTQKQL